MGKIRKITNIILLIIIIMFYLTTNVQAALPTHSTIESDGGGETVKSSGVIDPNDFKPPTLQDSDTDVIINKATVIVNVIRTIGIIVTVVSLILMGIKYMTGSIEEKADYKKSMIPYLIGVFIFFALTQLLGLVIEIAESFNA